MGNQIPFGGKLIILVGDFHQTGPVIQYGTKAQVIEASLRKSTLWPEGCPYIYCTINQLNCAFILMPLN
jgi:hypothetical protein